MSSPPEERHDFTDLDRIGRAGLKENILVPEMENARSKWTDSKLYNTIEYIAHEAECWFDMQYSIPHLFQCVWIGNVLHREQNQNEELNHILIELSKKNREDLASVFAIIANGLASYNVYDVAIKNRQKIKKADKHNPKKNNPQKICGTRQNR